MSKFYVLSGFLHILVIALILFSGREKEQKFKEKNTIIVSVKNRKAISNEVRVNSKPKEVIPEVKNYSKEDYKKEEKKKDTKVLKNDSKIIEKLKSSRKEEKSSVEKIEIQKEKQIYNEFQDINKFLQGEDGVFTAVSLDGIEYEILKEVDPKYPIRAKKMGYKGMGSIRVKFLVDIDGTVKNIVFLSGEQKFGFKEEVEKALKQWRFRPIKYKNKKIKLYFEKEFKFKKN
ncbi:MAG: energy transducer TonB [Cetobacterium sp.]